MEIQGKLFEVPPIKIERPTYKTIDGYDIYKKIAQNIIDWDVNADHEELISVADSLKSVFSLYNFLHDNGYKLCKELEKKLYYSPDEELVGIMENTSWYVRESVKEAEKKWVIDCCITPKYKIGDELEVIFKKEKYIGEIKDIDLELGRYEFYIPCAMSGTNIIGTFKNFEEVELDFFSVNKN